MRPDIKNIPQQLGKYHYQQINEPQLEAQLICIRESIESRIRKSAGYYEWYMVARTPNLKNGASPWKK